MSAELAKYIELILLGGLLGIIGQLVHAGAGLIKISGPLSASGAGAFDAFSTVRFVVSLFIGFIAGTATAFLLIDTTHQTVFSGTTKLCLAAAGYAGVDFIEGIAGHFSTQDPSHLSTPATGGTSTPPMASRGQANLLSG
jgi:hypothetical protein